MNTTRTRLRSALRPGDLGEILRLHGLIYGTEYGWNIGFEAYVAETLADFASHYNEQRDRVWLAEQNGRVAGSIAIVGREPGVAQLRWFLVHPEYRGAGLGRLLLDAAITHCRDSQQLRVFLLTVSELKTAAHLYESVGFQCVSRHNVAVWGKELIEERYELQLESGRSC